MNPNAASDPQKNHQLKQIQVVRITIWMLPKIVGFPPKSSILTGFSIIFTIHFGVPLFQKHPFDSNLSASETRTPYPPGGIED